MAANKSRTLLAAIPIVFCVGVTALADERNPRVTVYLDDYAHITPSVLSEAQDETDRIFSAAGGRAVQTLLGHVMAHEVGHLLLPEHSHSDTGIMRASFDMRALVQRFTPAQSQTLQQLLLEAVTISAQ